MAASAEYPDTREKTREVASTTPQLLAVVSDPALADVLLKSLRRAGHDFLVVDSGGPCIQIMLPGINATDIDQNYAVVRDTDLEFEDDAHQVRRAGRPVFLTPLENKLLRYLAGNAGKVVSRDRIIHHVWPHGLRDSSRALDAYICSLRRKIDFVEPRLIHTVHGTGYCLRTSAT